MKKIAFLVNPIAGMGGIVGLKGTDGLVEEARKRGALPHANDRARNAFDDLTDIKDKIVFYTCSGLMGGEIIVELGFEAKIIYDVSSESTNKDTVKACELFLKEDIDLLVFCGGDGTARDIYGVIGDKIPIIGIPAGVKMHSSVFSVNPEACGKIIREFVEGGLDLKESEVVDVDEEKFRANILDTKIYGYALTPYKPELIQASKEIYLGTGEDDAKAGISEFAQEFMRDGSTYILGPGTTVRSIAEKIGVEKTLLGVDIVCNGKLMAEDVGEKKILDCIKDIDCVKIIVSPIGAQGFIFGRGNQQISSDVIKKAGVDNIIIVATPHKLSELRYLRVDTGDKGLDEELSGYKSVVIGYQMAQKKDVIVD